MDYAKHHPFYLMGDVFVVTSPRIRICDMWERLGSVWWVTLSLQQKDKLKMSMKVENFLIVSSSEPSCYSSPAIFTQGLVGTIFILVIRGSNIQGLWNCEVFKMDYAKHHPFNGWCLCCHLLGEVTQTKDGCSKNLTRTRNVPPKCNKQVTSKQQTRSFLTSIN
jgi:hypothetical protein